MVRLGGCPRKGDAQTYQRVRTRRPVGLGINSALTRWVMAIEGSQASIHAAFLTVKRGQLRFLELT